MQLLHRSMQQPVKSMQNACSTCKNYAARTCRACKNPAQNGMILHGVATQWRRPHGLATGLVTNLEKNNRS